MRGLGRGVLRVGTWSRGLTHEDLVTGNTNNMSVNKENIRYSVLLGCYMMIMCAGFNYVTYYLLDRGVSDSKIGILIAVSCALAVVFQQLLGRRVDSGILNGKTVLLLFAGFMSALGFAIAVFRPAWLAALMYGMLMCSIQVMQPILNSFSFYYKSEGISVNYGVARGVGSLCYACFSMLLGLLTVRVGSVAVPLSLGLLSAAIFLIIRSMPAIQTSGVGQTSGVSQTSVSQTSVSQTSVSQTSGVSRSESETSGVARSEPETSGVARTAETSGVAGSFHLSQYPSFAMMLGGLVMVMLFHNMVMTYFIYVVERAGGDSGNMGLAIGLSGLTEIPIIFFYTRIKGGRPSRYFLAFSGVAFFAKATLFLFSRSMGMVYFVQCVQCLSYGLMAASRVYYVDETVGKENETTGQAYMTATETIGIVLGSSLGGFLIQARGIETLLWGGVAVSFMGMLLMVGSVLYERNRQRN